MNLDLPTNCMVGLAKGRGNLAPTIGHALQINVNTP